MTELTEAVMDNKIKMRYLWWTNGACTGRWNSAHFKSIAQNWWYENTSLFDIHKIDSKERMLASWDVFLWKGLKLQNYVHAMPIITLMPTKN